MTAQIEDKFHYKSREYHLVGISGERLFKPSQFDLEPEMATTACYRGYQAFFTISENCLVLDDLYVKLYKGEPPERGHRREEYVFKKGPEINGISPTKPEDSSCDFNNYYQNLNYELDYTGGLLIADKFIQDLYEHLGFQPPWKYKKVIELTFEKGILQKELDQSENMAKVRDKHLEAKRNGDESFRQGGIVRYINESFDRSYYKK